jgi:hypothetical protein
MDREEGIMRHRWIALGLAAAGLLIAPAARAGVYLPAEPVVGPTTNVQLFINLLSDLRGLRAPDNPLRKRYLARIAELEAKDQRDSLTVEDRVNLSGYFLRVDQPEKAVEVLGPVANSVQTDFRVLSNLSTAHELAGRPDRAISYGEQALAHWPRIWPGYLRTRLIALARAEKYHVALLKMRYGENSRQAPTGKVPDRPDALFPKVHFPAAGQPYAPGEMSAAEIAEMPYDATIILEQLILWTPNDQRLQWLFAELLTAIGGMENVMAAEVIFNTLVENAYSNAALREHRAIVHAAKTQLVALSQALANTKGPGAWTQLLWYAVPRGATLEPGAGALLTEAAWAGRALLEKRPATPSVARNSERRSDGPAPVAKGTNPWLPDVRHVVVSFLAGVLITILGVFQVREIRRKQHNAAAGKSGA